MCCSPRLAIHASIADERHPTERAPRRTGRGNAPALMAAYIDDRHRPTRALTAGNRKIESVMLAWPPLAVVGMYQHVLDSTAKGGIKSRTICDICFSLCGSPDTERIEEN